MCSALYGIAVQQGWANVKDRVLDRNSNARQCNRGAQFEHVLTMTGQSPDLSNPVFEYDGLGDACLDTLSDFIGENNPAGLTTFDWKQRFYHDVMGFEDGLEWGSAGDHVRCGYSVETSCRDLARAALLWANEGLWAGVGTVVNREYIQQGSRGIFPQSGADLGYMVWRHSNDPVDAEVSAYWGALSQCAYASRRHAAVIVSMGEGDPATLDCREVWNESRWAIVSGEQNITRAEVHDVQQQVFREVLP